MPDPYGMLMRYPDITDCGQRTLPPRRRFGDVAVLAERGVESRWLSAGGRLAGRGQPDYPAALRQRMRGEYLGHPLAHDRGRRTVVVERGLGRPFPVREHLTGIAES